MAIAGPMLLAARRAEKKTIWSVRPLISPRSGLAEGADGPVASSGSDLNADWVRLLFSFENNAEVIFRLAIGKITHESMRAQ